MLAPQLILRAFVEQIPVVALPYGISFDSLADPSSPIASTPQRPKGRRQAGA